MRPTSARIGERHQIEAVATFATRVEVVRLPRVIERLENSSCARITLNDCTKRVLIRHEAAGTSKSTITFTLSAHVMYQHWAGTIG